MHQVIVRLGEGGVRVALYYCSCSYKLHSNRGTLRRLPGGTTCDPRMHQADHMSIQRFHSGSIIDTECFARLAAMPPAIAFHPTWGCRCSNHTLITTSAARYVLIAFGSHEKSHAPGVHVVLQALVDELGAGRQVAQEPGVPQDLCDRDALLRARQQHLRQQVLARHRRLQDERYIGTSATGQMLPFAK